MRQDPALPGSAGPLLFAACGALLLLAAALAWLAWRPLPTPPAAPATDFSTARALQHVHMLAAAPRPAGSAANARARDYLVAQVRALGLEPEIQVATVQQASADHVANASVVLAEVRNVVVRKRGSGGTRQAVLASARYDSGNATPGAADGAADAAALLEALRVLQAGAPLHNDLLVVFTDADVQALGARGFAEAHPWARRVRVALRFDHAGNRGPLALVDATHADGFALAAWTRLASGVHGTHGSSFMAELTRGLPQRAAAAPLAMHGASVLHFATLDGTLGGAGAADIPARLSGASLQHEGDTMLALLRHFGDAALPEPGAHAGGRGQIFFALPGIGHVHYGLALAWPLALLACVLDALACRAAVRRLGIAGSDIVHGAFGFLFMAAAAVFATWLCRELLADLQPRYDAGVLAGDARTRWTVAAFLLLPAGLFAVLQRQLQARLGGACAALGVLLAATVALCATNAVAPGASYVLAWPLLAAQAAWLVLASPAARSWPRARRQALRAAAAVPALLLVVPAAWDGAAWLSPRWLLLPALLACLLVALCAPLLAQLRLRWTAAPLLLAGAACAAVAHGAPPAVPALPAPNRLVYLKDTPSWQAYWVHPAGPVDAWTRQVFPNALRPYVMPYTFGADSEPVWYAAAPPVETVAHPYLLIEKDDRRGDVRHVAFVLRSNNAAPELTLRMVGAQSLRTSVNGRVLTDRRYRGWRMTLHGMGDRELRFAFDLVGDPSFTIFIQERIPGLPDALPPRPPGLRPTLLPLTEATVVAAVLRFP
ncbi:M28 family peptidase [uncultured Massilia sp.]|uniref:M28 family peptidase n=1 Tax=uncultured Massilia sp. TaxID=169973 RepID=UPI0025E3621E|nr:M28 family peptidase [uncultured Massilia sp.]